MNWEWFGNALGAAMGTIGALFFVAVAVLICVGLMQFIRLIAAGANAITRWTVRNEVIEYFYDAREMADVVRFKNPKPFRVKIAKRGKATAVDVRALSRREPIA